MSEDKIKPKTDSELIQSWKLLESGSCAGANAASRVDFTIAATDPLSELVYSQDKGLSLKCAHSTFAHQNHSLFTAIMPHCQGNEENDTEGALNDQHHNLMDESGKNTCDIPNIGIEGNIFSTIPDEHKHSMEQNPSAKKCSNEGLDIGKGKKTVVIEDAVFEPIIDLKACVVAETNLASSSRNPLEKLESTAENDLQTSRVIVMELSNKSQNNEMMLACDKILPLSHYQCHSRIDMAINEGKEKSLSDGEAKVRLSEDENDSNSSVESCNSTGSFSTGNKRRKFSQQLIIGSKRVKNQIEENFGSKSYVKRDSSFMNWISNVVNGLPQSIQDVPVSDGRLITCNTNQYLEPKNTGFKSLFRSIYSPSLKNSGTRKSHEEGEGCKDIEPGYMVHGIEATPITCCGENNSLYRQYLQSNRFEVSADKYEAGPSSQPMIKPLHFLNTIESSKDKEEMRSHSPSTTQNTNNTDNVDTIALSDRREAGNIHHKTDSTLGSVWITRFAPKSTAPLIISDHLNEKVGSQVHVAGSSKIPNDSNKHISYLRNCNALFNYHIPSGEHISPRNERSTRLRTSEEDRILSGSCSIDGADHKEERNLKKSNQAITSKVGCYASFEKYRSGSSEVNKFKEDPGTSASKLVERFSQDSHIPQRISDAVKRLRLSRTDILKWINTHGSISQLDGFYLRLRLGKWEEGLRGTEYHVASINEGERQSSEQSTTKSVSVNVRGVKYMLEIRYISNHDFLEEEIMEWWFTTTEAGAAIPSEQDLNKRIQKKIVLGL